MEYLFYAIGIAVSVALIALILSFLVWGIRFFKRQITYLDRQTYLIEEQVKASIHYYKSGAKYFKVQSRGDRPEPTAVPADPDSELDFTV